jgi:hypothetical protein
MRPPRGAVVKYEIDFTNMFRDAAVEYARQGWPVYPTTPSKKKPPLTEHGAYSATTDAAQIKAWWMKHPKANIALATGKGIDGIDIDRDVEGFKKLCAEISVDLEKIHRHKSAHGGWHLFGQSTGLRCPTHRFGEYKGIGGSIHLPPSFVDDEKGAGRYEVLGDGQVAAFPPQLLTALGLTRDDSSAEQQTCCPHPSAPAEKYFEVILDKLAATGAGVRNDALNKAAFAIGRWIKPGKLDRGLYEERLTWTTDPTVSDRRSGRASTPARGSNTQSPHSKSSTG